MRVAYFWTTLKTDLPSRDLIKRAVKAWTNHAVTETRLHLVLIMPTLPIAMNSVRNRELLHVLTDQEPRLW